MQRGGRSRTSRRRALGAAARRFLLAHAAHHLRSSLPVTATCTRSAPSPETLADIQREGGSALDVGAQGCAGPEGARRRLVGALCQHPEPHGARHDDFMTIDSFRTRLQALSLNREGLVELCHQNKIHAVRYAVTWTHSPQLFRPYFDTQPLHRPPLVREFSSRASRSTRRDTDPRELRETKSDVGELGASEGGAPSSPWGGWG